MSVPFIVSCFDGISCAAVGFERLGIMPNYVGIEIDPVARTIADSYRLETPGGLHSDGNGRLNYVPLTKILRPCHDIKAFRRTMIKGSPDYLIAGFPCQSFSVAGKQAGFADKRGQLYKELLRVRNAIKPKRFIFECSVSDGTTRDTLTKAIGVSPIQVNSMAFGAQHRDRYYWIGDRMKSGKYRAPLLPDRTEPNATCIADILLPHDDPIVIRDCNFYQYKPLENPTGKHVRIIGDASKGDKKKPRHPAFPVSQSDAVHDTARKNTAIRNSTGGHGGHGGKTGLVPVASCRVGDANGKTQAITAGGGGGGAKTGLTPVYRHNDEQHKASGLTAAGGSGKPLYPVEKNVCRTLSTVEVCRLMHLPDDYLEKAITELGVAKGRAIGAVGNGMDAAVISWIIESLEGL